MNNVIHTQDQLFVDQANVTLPYSAETIAMNGTLVRSSRPFSALKERKFRTLFNRHRGVSGYR